MRVIIQFIALSIYGLITPSCSYSSKTEKNSISEEIESVEDISDILNRSVLPWNYYERIAAFECKKTSRLNLTSIADGSTILVFPGDTLYYFYEVHNSVGHNYSIDTDSTILVESYMKYNWPEQQVVGSTGLDDGEKITSIIPLKEGKFNLKITHLFRGSIKAEENYNIIVRGKPIGLANLNQDSILPNMWNILSNLETVSRIYKPQDLGIASESHGVATTVFIADTIFIRNVIRQLIPAKWKLNVSRDEDWTIYGYSHKTSSDVCQSLIFLNPSRKDGYPYIPLIYLEGKP